jgi:FAD/FMN-containing dehydrogenase
MNPVTLQALDIVRPGDARYDEARPAWNLAVDQRPAAVAIPRDADQVVAAVLYAKREGLRVAAQGTGHNASPLGDLSDTLLIKTHEMRGVEIDADNRVARVEAGAQWGDVVAPAGEYGLAALAGSSHDVGVVGYSLGGGVSFLARRYGLSSSRVLSAEVVTADGEVVRADRETNADLFWALRGGGGSFGIVTEVEIALFPVTEAYAGWLVWPMERATEVLGAWAEWSRDAPEAVTSVGRMLQSPPIPEKHEPLRGRQVVVVEAAFRGTVEVGRELLRPLRELGPELDTVATVPAAARTQLHQDPPGPVPGSGEGWMLDGFDAAAAAEIVRAAGMDGTAPLISVEVRHLEGALGRPDPNGGVLSHFEAPYVMYAIGVAPVPEAARAAQERISSIRAAAAPWLSRSSYFNFAEADVEGSSLYPAGNYERLTEIRAERDPDGVFRAKHAID